MLKNTMIAATALFAATFLVAPQADAAMAGANMKSGIETAGVQLVGGRHGDHDGRRDRRHGGRHESRRDGRGDRHGWRGHRGEFRGHDGLRRYGYRDFRGFRWDGRGYVTRAYHPRHGWVWVRVSERSGRPLAYWH